MKSRRVAWTLVRVVVGAALVVWLSRTGALDWRSASAFADNWRAVATAEAAFMIALALTALRLVVLFRATDMRLSISNAIQLCLVGIFFNLVFPGGGGGDVIRIWFATEGNEGRRAEVVAVMLLDRIVGLFALILWPLLALLAFPSVRALPVVQGLAAAAGIALAILIGVLLIAFSERLQTTRLVQWVFTRPLGGILQRMVMTVHAYRRAPMALLTAGAISLVAHGFGLGSTVLLAMALLGDQFDSAVWALLPFGFLANALPLTPGGLGVGETAFDRLFNLVGLPKGALVLIGWRLLSLPPAALGLAVYLRGRRQFVAP